MAREVFIAVHGMKYNPTYTFRMGKRIRDTFYGKIGVLFNTIDWIKTYRRFKVFPWNVKILENKVYTWDGERGIFNEWSLSESKKKWDIQIIPF